MNFTKEKKLAVLKHVINNYKKRKIVDKMTIRTLEVLFADLESEHITEQMNISTTTKIKKWAVDRGLDQADPKSQMIKLVEEVGELASGLAKNKEHVIIDSIGDIYVVLTILSMQLGLDVETCIKSAYEEIKDRKGKMVNGIFIKQGK